MAHPLDDIFALIDRHAEAVGDSAVAVAARVLGLIISDATDRAAALDDANHQLERFSLYLEEMDDEDDEGNSDE